MKCVICHGDRIEPREVQEEFRIGNDVVYVDIKVPVCQTCGERYYDRATMKLLEETGEKLKNKQLELEEVGKVLIYNRLLKTKKDKQSRRSA